MSAPTNKGVTPQSPPANAPVAAAPSSSATAPTVHSTAAPTIPAANSPQNYDDSESCLSDKMRTDIIRTKFWQY